MIVGMNKGKIFPRGKSWPRIAPIAIDVAKPTGIKPNNPMTSQNHMTKAVMSMLHPACNQDATICWLLE